MLYPKHKNKTHFFYSLNNETLEYVTTNPSLGIIISNDMWHSHISTITKQANSTISFLRRNIRRCPTNSKRMAYIALVRVLEYGASVGSIPSGDIDKLEKIQYYAAHFITGDYRSRNPGSVTTMLTNLNLDTFCTKLLRNLSQLSPLKHYFATPKEDTFSLSTSQVRNP